MVSANYVDHYVYDGEGRLSGYNFTAGGGTAYSWNTSYTYDDFDRLGSRSIDWDENGSGILWDTTYTYAVAGSVVYDQIKNVTNTVVRKDTSAAIDSETFTYIYDDNGNITIIRRDGLEMLRYGYDELGQLVREDNRYTGKSYTWTYDNAGNILNRKTYAYTIDALGTAQNTVIYGYDTGNWGDLLTSFNGRSIAYDGIGNPGTWNGSALTWQGRRLMSYGSNTYTYNADGIRTSKTVNGVEHIYHLSGTQILSEEWTEGNVQHILIFVYDASGNPIGMSHYENGAQRGTYVFVKNIQGDITGIYDDEGTCLVTYTYDAWGNVTVSYSNGGASTAAKYNPFRYRGYYYDNETSLYYLNSRYYDSNVGRFLNADIYINANPVMYHDVFGDKPEYIISAQNSETMVDGKSMKDISFGFGNIAKNGCGVIAAYNVIASYGTEITFNRVKNGVIIFGGLLFFGALGSNPFAIRNYLMTYFGLVTSAGPLTYTWGIIAELSEAVIVLLAYSDTWHYVAGISDGGSKYGGSFKFYNTGIKSKNKSIDGVSMSIWEFIEYAKVDGGVPLYIIGVNSYYRRNKR